MRFLVDGNFPYHAVDPLRRQGHSATDEEVLARARTETRVLLTADKDFGEMIFARSDTAPGVLLVRSRLSHPAAKVDLAIRAIEGLGEA